MYIFRANIEKYEKLQKHGKRFLSYVPPIYKYTINLVNIYDYILSEYVQILKLLFNNSFGNILTTVFIDTIKMFQLYLLSKCSIAFS